MTQWMCDTIGDAMHIQENSFCLAICPSLFSLTKHFNSISKVFEILQVILGHLFENCLHECKFGLRLQDSVELKVYEMTFKRASSSF